MIIQAYNIKTLTPNYLKTPKGKNQQYLNENTTPILKINNKAYNQKPDNPKPKHQRPHN